MAVSEAFSVHRHFDPGGPFDFCMDRHYLLYARRGLLRLEAEGWIWTLPPARAALVRADSPIRVGILAPTDTASVLIAPSFMAEPATPLSVFDLSPLGRELLREATLWTSPAQPLDAYGRAVFAALAQVALRLAANPTPCALPAPTSPALQKAVALTRARAADTPSFAAIARDSGQSPRALARRFRDELGMTWGDLLRRIRIIAAVEALSQSQASITAIAGQCGYASLSAFNAAFKDLMKLTPSQYRATLNPAAPDAPIAP